MRFFTAPEDVLLSAMSSKQPQVRLEKCIGSLDNILKNTLKKERRLLAFLSSYEANYFKKGLVQLCYDYDVTLQYQEKAPLSINDVILDNGDWDPNSIFEKGKPQDLIIVTNELSEIQSKMTEIIDLLLSKYEGIHGWQTRSLSFDKLSDDVVCYLSYSYILPTQTLRQLQGKTSFAAKTIWKTILGRANVPQFVKPFLALSYLSQKCCYDQRAYDEVEADAKSTPSDPIPHLAYGPLVENRGICGGLAWAFKRLMDYVNIECICVSGYFKDSLKVIHMWNLVKLDGQYYHVDSTWGIECEGIFIGGFLQPDSMIKSTHIWEYTQYPAAKGIRFSYDYIEDFLAENGDEFLNAGAAEKYMFPDDIVE